MRRVLLVTLTEMELRTTLYLVLATYFTNGAPVLFGGGRSIDGGRTFPDGGRILGDNKTVRGFVGGLLVGLVVSVALGLFAAPWVFGFSLLASLGALIGDLFGAFLKRRLGIPAGGMLPIVDQLDFVAGALLFVVAAFPVPVASIVLLIIVTPPIHLATNVAAFYLGLKKTYW